MTGGRARTVLFWGVLVVAAALVLAFPGVAAAVSRTYTTNADFDEGVLVGVEHDSAPNSLQLDSHPALLPYIWLPNNGDGTISKIDTRTGDEVGRYHVSPHFDSLPSRTTVDLRGNCWVGVRQAGTVVKIGLYEAGQWVDRNGDGICQTSYDANANGLIDPGEVLPWGEDECVLVEIVLIPGYEGAYVPGTYTGPYDYNYWGVSPRGMAVDAYNNVWAGTWSTSKFFYLNGDTGAILDVVDVAPLGHNSYGAVIDRNGVLWSSSLGGCNVLRLDPSTNPPTLSRVDFSHMVYGLGVDYLGHLFVSGPNATTPTLSRINVDTGLVEWEVTAPGTCCLRGIAVTEDNDVWLADTDGDAVYRYDNDGNLKATISGVAGPAGVAVDAAGKIWIGDLNDENIHRVDPATNTIDLTKQILGGGGHYTYSDMTGAVAWTVTSKNGEWTTTYDSGAPATPWGTISWNATVPEGGYLNVEARSSADQINWSNWEVAASGVPLTGTPDGRYLQVRVALERRYGAASPVLEDLTVDSNSVSTRTVSCTSFEQDRAPWSALIAGPGEANVWRQALTSPTPANTGLYAMSAEVSGQGAAGLVLALPTEPAGTEQSVLRSWVNFDARTEGDASTFLGFSFASEVTDYLSGVASTVGWEIQSGTMSQLRLLDSVQPTAVGVATGGWHLAEVRFTRSSGTLDVLLDGRSVDSLAVPLAAGLAPTYAIMCAGGAAPGALQRVYLDDTTVTLLGHPTPELNRPFALLQGQEQIAEGRTQSLQLAYGNGYPILQPGSLDATLPDTLHVALSLPAGYALASANPAPSRLVDGSPVWDLPLPALDQAGLILVDAVTPSGLSEARVDHLWAWATTNAAAGSSGPPSPAGVSLPPDPVWGAPQDLLGQRIELGPKPDVWVRMHGPAFASPGDTVNYQVEVGNCGNGPALGVAVHNEKPDLLGGGDRIIANLASLAPGETWTGVTFGALPWGIPEGTMLTNTASVPAVVDELATGNNTGTATTTIQGARDPNSIAVSPNGGTDRGQRLVYTLHCENVGAGTAYGVYATCPVPSGLDPDTLRTSDPAAMRYDAANRTLVWEVGRLNGGQAASAWFSTKVTSGARRARPIPVQATVFFPSVPETTPTNVVFNIVASSFTDMPWDQWAVLPVELAYEHDVVKGFKEGTYQPTTPVKRGQMAAFIARAVAGGDANVPAGPATPTFSDVDPSFWAYSYIEYAVAQGIVTGYAEDNTYRPAERVNRGQMAAFIARALAGGEANVPAGPGSPSFTDIPTDFKFYKHIEYIVTRGVTGGYADGTYRADPNILRDQMAVFIQRAFEYSD